MSFSRSPTWTSRAGSPSSAVAWRMFSSQRTLSFASIGTRVGLTRRLSAFVPLNVLALTRERAELAGAAGRAEGPRPGDRARAGGRRRRARLLEGAGEVFPATRHQRCWVHRAADVLNKLPK